MYFKLWNSAYSVISNYLWNKKLIFLVLAVKIFGIFKHKDYL